eukprot:4557267-Pyramimonas_sp.AAC.2
MHMLVATAPQIVAHAAQRAKTQQSCVCSQPVPRALRNGSVRAVSSGGASTRTGGHGFGLWSKPSKGSSRRPARNVVVFAEVRVTLMKQRDFESKREGYVQLFELLLESFLRLAFREARHTGRVVGCRKTFTLA